MREKLRKISYLCTFLLSTKKRACKTKEKFRKQFDFLLKGFGVFYALGNIKQTKNSRCVVWRTLTLPKIVIHNRCLHFRNKVRWYYSLLRRIAKQNILEKKIS